jgi:hypothetical protein
MVGVLLEQSDGPLQESTRELGTFRADRLALAEWLNRLNVERLEMLEGRLSDLRLQGNSGLKDLADRDYCEQMAVLSRRA